MKKIILPAFFLLSHAIIPIASGQVQLQPGENTRPEAQPSEQRPSAPASESAASSRALQEEIQRMSDEVSSIYREAMKDEEVVDARDEYEEVLHEEMIRLAPEMEDTVKETAELAVELQETEDVDEMGMEERMAFQQKAVRHQQLRQQLLPVERQAHQEDEVAAKHSQYQQLLMAQMNEVNPEFREILQRRQEAIQEFQQNQPQVVPQQPAQPEPQSQQAPRTVPN